MISRKSRMTVTHLKASLRFISGHVLVVVHESKDMSNVTDE